MHVCKKYSYENVCQQVRWFHLTMPIYIGEYEISSSFHLRALEIYEGLGDSLHSAEVCDNFGYAQVLHWLPVEKKKNRLKKWNRAEDILMSIYERGCEDCQEKPPIPC